MSKRKGHKSNRRLRVIEPSSPLFDKFDKIATCDSKNKYDNEWQAAFVIDETLKKNGTELRSYRCPYCGYWHLTGNTSIIGI